MFLNINFIEVTRFLYLYSFHTYLNIKYFIDKQCNTSLLTMQSQGFLAPPFWKHHRAGSCESGQWFPSNSQVSMDTVGTLRRLKIVLTCLEMFCQCM